MARGERDHFLPAAYVGRFSATTGGPARARRVHVFDKRAGGTFTQSAQNIAYKSGLYDLTDGLGDEYFGGHIDRWGYESGLPAALDRLRLRVPVEADDWARHLVPFLAGLFARGPEHNNGNNNIGRIWAFQEMLAPVMISDWTVLHYPPGTLIGSDRGLAAIETPHGRGIAVPIDPATAILLTHSDRRVVAKHVKGSWRAAIAHADLDFSDATHLRGEIAKHALFAVYGPVEPLVRISESDLGQLGGTFPALIVNPRDYDLACHIYDYFRFCSAIESPSIGLAQAEADRVSLEAVLPEWRTPLAIQLNFAERTKGGVRVDERGYIEMSAVLGREICRLRRSVGDFRRGSFIVMPIEHVRDQAVSLGNMCRETVEGRRGVTRIVDFKNGRDLVVSLDAWP